MKKTNINEFLPEETTKKAEETNISQGNPV